jgi:hypothetical protein
MKERTWLYGVFALTLAISLGLGGLAQAGDKSKCINDDYDDDRDHYAGDDAVVKKISVRHSEKLNCPKGWVRKDGDDKDNDSKIHPRRPEVPNNGKDDNCNGKKDEPEFVYLHENRNRWVTTSSFRVKMKLNDQVLYSRGRRLHVSLRLKKLNTKPGESTSATTKTVTNVNLQGQRGTRHATFIVTGLDKESVYRVDRVQFKDASTNHNLGDSTSDEIPYFTVTDGTSNQAKRRTAILLRGFKEYGESKMGKVGYYGTEYKDGTKYGARKGELWCSEFYAWVTKPYLEGISRRSSVSSLRRFFRQRNQYKRTNTDVLARAHPGDYVSMDTDNDKKKDHSGMFLAWESDQNKVWLLEGNTSGNEVNVRDRAPSEVDGLGHISASMPLSNHQACKKWCASSSKCVKCSTKKGCGPGYKWLRSYTGPGTNYHACAELKRSKGNREKCEKWCKESRKCAKCDTNIGCGVGYTKIKSWTKGGTNWYACGERKRSRDHRSACEEWCRARSECAKCSTKYGCGIGYKRIKSWTGRGTNWHACERR